MFTTLITKVYDYVDNRNCLVYWPPGLITCNVFILSNYMRTERGLDAVDKVPLRLVPIPSLADLTTH